MTVHLFKNGSAMINGHNSSIVTVVPQTKGTLHIGDISISVDGVTEITENILPGMKSAKFVDGTGKEYYIGTCSVKSGATISLNCESKSVIELMHKTDELSEKYDLLLQKYEELRAKVEYTAIDFIMGEKK